LQVFSRTSFEKQLSENLQSCAAEPSSAPAIRTATCSSSHCGKCVFALCRKKALHPRRRENNQTFNLSSGFIFHVKGRRTSGEMNVKPRPKKRRSARRGSRNSGEMSRWNINQWVSDQITPVAMSC
jgi:hypothetical protein